MYVIPLFCADWTASTLGVPGGGGAGGGPQAVQLRDQGTSHPQIPKHWLGCSHNLFTQHLVIFSFCSYDTLITYYGM